MNKDLFGNNSLHFVFDIRDQKQRYEILALLIDENIGDPDKRNKLGFLPIES